MKDGKFEKGDRLVCVDDSDRDNLYKGKFYIYDKLSKYDPTDCINIKGDKEAYLYKRFKLVEPEAFQPEYFSALNASKAEKYIGKQMEFADGSNLDKWEKGILIGCKDKALYPFISSLLLGGCFHFTRTIQHKEKPNHSELIKALKLSIQQWQIMRQPFVY